MTDPNTATILCVDDEESGLQIRKLLLESAGYQVLTARSGPEGIRLFREQKINLVLVDYWMGGMNGLAFARELKRLSPSTPIVILSAYASLPGETLGLADLWIRKGEDDPQYLLSKLRQLLDEKAIS
jgi:CheY-like chemotaxis protein